MHGSDAWVYKTKEIELSLPSTHFSVYKKFDVWTGPELEQSRLKIKRMQSHFLSDIVAAVAVLGSQGP